MQVGNHRESNLHQQGNSSDGDPLSGPTKWGGKSKTVSWKGLLTRNSRRVCIDGRDLECLLKRLLKEG